MRFLILSLLVSLILISAALAGENVLPERPLTLGDCVALALGRNPQLMASRQSVVSAEAGLERARSGYWPQLSLSWSEGYTGTESSFSDRVKQEEADFVLRQSLWQRGRRESVKQSAASLTAAANTYEASVQGLLETAAGDYYGVLAAERLVGVAEARMRFAEEHLAEVKARVEVGETAEVEIASAEEDLARAQLGEIDARSNLRLALAQLKNTLGLSPETPLELAEAAPSAEKPLPTLGEAIQTALASRPEVVSARASLEKSRYGLASAKIRRGPGVEFYGQYDKGYSEWEAQDPSWQMLMSLSWPLFDGGATRADVTSARAEEERAAAQLQTLVNQAGLEVESALVEVERARQRMETTAKSAAAAQARLTAAEARYREGMAIFLEVSDALAALTDARASEIQAGYDYQLAQVRLRRVIGLLRPEDFAAEQNDDRSD